MARLTKKLIDKASGGRDARTEGVRRTLTGIRERDRRELYIGLALTALAYLRKTGPQRELIFKKTVPAGSAIVVHHKRSGDPKIEVIKP
jgi:hypothetical protein